VLSLDSGHELQKTIDLSTSHSSPVLYLTSIKRNAFLTSSMSGHWELYGPGDTPFSLLDVHKQHNKYAVQVIITPSIFRSEDGTPMIISATAGWDQKICISIFRAPGDVDESNSVDIKNVVATISLPTNPESILFVRHPDTNDLYLIVGRCDSTYLYYYRLTEEETPTQTPHISISVDEAGRQNLAPNANAWISFSPASIASCPTDPTLIAVATSHLPHMKLLLVRLLFPDSRRQETASASENGRTQTSQARAELALQDREDVAIMLHVSTMAPQTPYSTPQVVWRPDGSGVWVNGDDGVIRGVEAKTGKVVASLKGHETGSKVRSLWAGMVRVESEQGTDGEGREEEWLVSGGFDKKVIVWKPGGGIE
jgi:hypothetical protein